MDGKSKQQSERFQSHTDPNSHSSIFPDGLDDEIRKAQAARLAEEGKLVRFAVSEFRFSPAGALWDNFFAFFRFRASSLPKFAHLPNGLISPNGPHFANKFISNLIV
jgi:hypothetical protein